MSPTTELNQGIYFTTSWKLTCVNLTALLTWHKSQLNIMTLNHYALLIHPCYNGFFFFFANNCMRIIDQTEVNVILSAPLPSFSVSFFTESNPCHHVHAAVEEFRGADGQLSGDSG